MNEQVQAPPPPITMAMIPKSIEQRSLDALLRIEKLLDERNNYLRQSAAVPAQKASTPQQQHKGKR